MESSNLPWRQAICKAKLRMETPNALGVPGNYTWQPTTFCASLLYHIFWQQAFKGTFISLITKLVLDLMREICPFICAFFPSSSYLKKKKRISITKALYISSLLLMMWPFAPIYLHGNKLPPPPRFEASDA